MSDEQQTINMDRWMNIETQYKRNHILTLVQNNHKTNIEAIRSYASKAQFNIGLSSAIFAVVGAIDKSGTNITQPAIFALFIVWALAFAFSFIVIFPATMSGGPLEATWDEAQRVEQKSAEEFYDWMIVSYLLCIQENKEVISYKRRAYRIATIFIALEIVVVAVIALST